ncbi:hypothetical protein Tco_0698440 [Tanacetum coccineum]
MHKTALAAEARENVAKVQEKLLEEDIEKIVEGEEEESYASAFADLVSQYDKDINTRIEPGSHKEHPETVDDNDDVDDKVEEKKDDNDDDNDDDDNDDHTNHTLIKEQVTSKPGSHKEHSETVDDDDDVDDKVEEKKDDNDDDDSDDHTDHTLIKDQTSELLKKEVPRMINDAINKDREIATSNVPELISRFVAHAPRIIEELFKTHVKDTVLNVHPPANTSIETTTTADLITTLFKDKIKSSSSIHDAHHGNDGPPKGEKRTQRQKISKGYELIVKFCDAMLERVLNEVKLKIFETKF